MNILSLRAKGSQFRQATPSYFSLKFSSSKTVENLLSRVKYVWHHRAIFRFYLILRVILIKIVS